MKNMKNMKNKIYLNMFSFLAFILFYNCTNKSKNNISLKSINASGKNEVIKIKSDDVKLLNVSSTSAAKVVIPSDIFNSKMDLNDNVYDFKLIPLETTSEGIIGYIDNILYDSNFYFIHDRRNKKLLRFSKSGKFLNSIGTIGKGPNELLEMRDVAINTEKKFVSILDLKSRKIFRFKYSGEFIDSKPLYYMASQLEYGNNSLIFGTSIVQKNKNIPLLESYRLIIADTNSIPSGLAFKSPDNSFVAATKRPLRKFNNSIYYNQPFSNGIWEVKENNLIPFIKFEFEKNGFPDEVWKKEISTIELRKLMDKHIYFSGHFIINDKYSFFRFVSNRKVSSMFLNTSSKNLKYGKDFKVSKNNPSMLLYRDPIGVGENNSFIAKIDATELFSYRKAVEKEKVESNFKPKYWEVIKNIEQTDNPLIVTYKLKDF